MRRQRRQLTFGLALALSVLALVLLFLFPAALSSLRDWRESESAPNDLARFDAATERRLRIGSMLAPHLERIERDYLERLDEDALIRKAISSLYDLDDFSRFYTKEEYAALRRSSGGYALSVGITVEARGGAYVVGEVLDGSSAKHRGVRPGDRILSFAEGPTFVPAASLPYDRLLSILGGVDRAEGSVIRLIIRSAQGKPREVALERTVLPVRTVHDARLGNDGIGFVRISRFAVERDGSPSTAGELERAIRPLFRTGRLRALVLDLRGNLGGDLYAAAACADLFLSGGIIVSTRGRVQGANEVLYADTEEGFPGDILRGAPLAILSDSHTASASEVLIGALIDAEPKRAVLVGGRTYGKGVAQTFRDLPGGEGVKMTTRKFFSPKGRSPDKKGFDPDIPVSAPSASAPLNDPVLDRARAELARELTRPTSR